MFHHIFPSFGNWSGMATLYSETFSLRQCMKKSTKHHLGGGGVAKCPPGRGFIMLKFTSPWNTLPQLIKSKFLLSQQTSLEYLRISSSTHDRIENETGKKSKTNTTIKRYASRVHLLCIWHLFCVIEKSSGGWGVVVNFKSFFKLIWLTTRNRCIWTHVT